MDARRGRWRFVLQIFLLVKGNHLAVLLVTAVVTVLKELLERREQKRINLNVVTSALHPHTLAVPAGELVRQAGAQLQLDTRGIPHICHRHHRRCLCKYFLPGVIFFQIERQKLALYPRGILVISVIHQIWMKKI